MDFSFAMCNAVLAVQLLALTSTPARNSFLTFLMLFEQTAWRKARALFKFAPWISRV